MADKPTLVTALFTRAAWDSCRVTVRAKDMLFRRLALSVNPAVTPPNGDLGFIRTMTQFRGATGQHSVVARLLDVQGREIDRSTVCMSPTRAPSTIWTAFNDLVFSPCEVGAYSVEILLDDEPVRSLPIDVELRGH